MPVHRQALTVSRHTMRILLIVTSLAGTISCNQTDTTAINNTDTPHVKSHTTDNVISTTENSKAVITDSTHNYAESILSGIVKPSDNQETINCLDSILSNNPKTRKFYFDVFRVIADKSDGALTDMVCSYSKSIFQTHPHEFITFYQGLSQTEKSNFIEFIAYEFGNTGTEYMGEVNEYFAAVNQTCKECSDIEKQFIQTIKGRVIKSVMEQFD